MKEITRLEHRLRTLQSNMMQVPTRTTVEKMLNDYRGIVYDLASLKTRGGNHSALEAQDWLLAYIDSRALYEVKGDD